MSGSQSRGFTIGIDVGGTWIRLASVRDAHEVISRKRVPVAEIERTPDAFVDRIGSEIAQLCSSPGLAAGGLRCTVVGMAVPAVLDAASRAVLRSVNLPFLQGIPLRAMMEERLELPVLLTTDAQACCRAEFETHKPSARCFVHLRFGTGIGCAVARAGRVDLLEREGSHHPTLLVVERGPGAIPCRCGLTGCLETVASGWALENGDFGHAGAGAIRALINLASHYRPEVICMGGGLLEHQARFAQSVVQGYAAQQRESDWLPPLVGSRLGDDAGVIGAACAARQSAQAAP